MEANTTLPSAILLHVAQQLSIPLRGLLAVVELLDGGATVPFIARYRKEVTGNLDEVQIRDIEEKLAYFRELEERRGTVLKTIEEQGKLTPELRARIDAVLDKSELEDLYLPYKPKRRTKAQIARERGLEPLAQFLWDQAPGDLLSYASGFVDAAKDVPSIEAALEGARHIVSEWVSENAEFRKYLRQQMLEQGVVVSRLADEAKDPEGKFKMYADFKEPAAKIPSHRMLAIRRGSTEGVLNFEIELDRAHPLSYLRTRVVKSEGGTAVHLLDAIEDSWDRLLNPSLQTEVRLELKQRSDEEAIRVFRDNLQNLLLSPPAGQLGVLAIDPGIRTGCKIAVVDDTGKFLESSVIYPLEPRHDAAGSAKTLQTLIGKHNVRAIAIGNGTASREVSAFVQEFLRAAELKDVFTVMVNESGASVYSASDIARQEFPDLDLTVRGAISIARRLQDPLAELVKVDPKSIGVGQYQHDVDQRKLAGSLDATVESCVNRVGVDLNTASFALLKYVAGVTERTAIHIVSWRNQNGRFRSRKQLMDVPGVGPKTFEQAAGFLRIRGGENVLDMTAVHPESYAVVERIAQSLGVTVEELISKPQLVDTLKLEGFQTATVGMYTLGDIREELKKPGRDPRDQFVAPKWRDDVRTLADVQPDMVLEGTVTNVTNFGAFVDIGVHQDGLVHVSELSNRFIKDPREAVKVGQVVKVKVLTVDARSKRIALSMKALMAAPQGPSRPQQKPAAARQAPPKAPDMQDKLAQLSAKWGRR